MMGTLVRCEMCGGSGLLHQPDELPETATPTPEPNEPADDEIADEIAAEIDRAQEEAEVERLTHELLDALRSVPLPYEANRAAYRLRRAIYPAGESQASEPAPADDRTTRALQVYEDLAAASPGDMFAFDQAPGQRVAVVVAAFGRDQPVHTMREVASVAPGHHVGRAWSGHVIEDHCPCPQEPCGLVDPIRAVPECEHHPVTRGKSIRQSHRAHQCHASEPDAPKLAQGGRRNGCGPDCSEGHTYEAGCAIKPPARAFLGEKPCGKPGCPCGDA